MASAAAADDTTRADATLPLEESQEQRTAAATPRGGSATIEKKRKRVEDTIVKTPDDNSIQRPRSSTSSAEGVQRSDVLAIEAFIGGFDWSEYAQWKDRDVIEMDRQNIKQQLSSGSSTLVLETSASNRSHCRASFCIPQQLRGLPNIESRYRFNLMDRTGQRTGDMAWYPREYETSGRSGRS